MPIGKIKHVATYKDLVWLATIFSVPLTTILTIFGIGLWTVFGNTVVDAAKAELGLYQTEQAILENNRLIQKALGEDRIIKQPEHLSYVEEPVHVDRPILVNLIIGRTEKGKSCTYMGGQAVFIQPTGATISGETLPFMNQTTHESRYYLTVNFPDTDRFSLDVRHKERWALYFNMEFVCDGETIFDATSVMPFTVSVCEKCENHDSHVK